MRNIELNPGNVTVTETKFITDKERVYNELKINAKNSLDTAFSKILQISINYIEPRQFKQYRTHMTLKFVYEPTEQDHNINSIRLDALFHRDYLNKTYHISFSFPNKQVFYDNMVSTKAIFNYYMNQRDKEVNIEPSYYNKSSIYNSPLKQFDVPPIWLVKLMCEVIYDKSSRFDVDNIKKELFNHNAL